MEDNSTVKFHNACSNHGWSSGFIHMESLNISTANNVTYVLQVDAKIIMVEKGVLVIYGTFIPGGVLGGKCELYLNTRQ